MDFPYLFQHWTLFTTFQHCQKDSFLPRLHVVRAEGGRYRLFMLMDFPTGCENEGRFMVRRSGSNNNSRTSQNQLLSDYWTNTCQALKCCAVLLLKGGGEAMINIFQLVCESVFWLTMHLCIKRLDGSVFNKVERTRRSLDKSSCEVSGLHTFTSVGRLGSSDPDKTRGPVKPNQPPSVTHPATLGAISSMLIWSPQTERGGLWEVWQ